MKTLDNLDTILYYYFVRNQSNKIIGAFTIGSSLSFNFVIVAHVIFIQIFVFISSFIDVDILLITCYVYISVSYEL